MLGSVLGISALQTSEYFCTGIPPLPLGTAHPRNAPYQGFDASDRQFVLAAGNESLWRKLCALIGRDDLVNDARFVSQKLRAQNQIELAAILAPIFRARPANDWLVALDAAGIPCAPVNTFDQILEDPHVAWQGWVQELALPNGARMSAVGFPIGLGATSPMELQRPPSLGEHGAAVILDWIGTINPPE